MKRLAVALCALLCASCTPLQRPSDEPEQPGEASVRVIITPELARGCKHLGTDATFFGSVAGKIDRIHAWARRRCAGRGGNVVLVSTVADLDGLNVTAECYRCEP